MKLTDFDRLEIRVAQLEKQARRSRKRDRQHSEAIKRQRLLTCGILLLGLAGYLGFEIKEADQDLIKDVLVTTAIGGAAAGQFYDGRSALGRDRAENDED